MDNQEQGPVTNFSAPDVVAKYDIYPLMHKALGRPAFLKFVGEVEGQKVVDLGCGSGHLCDELQRKGAKCVGIDASDSFVQLARSRYPTLDFYVANGRNIAVIPTGSVDKVLLSMVVLSIPIRTELEQVFSECARILTAQGELLISTIHPLNMHPFKDGARSIELPVGWNYFQSGASYQVSVNLTDGSQMKIVNAHWGLQDISQALNRAGFVIKKLEEPELSKDSEFFEQLKDLRLVPYYLFFRAIKD